VGASGDGPRPFKQRCAKTIFLRVPYMEWSQVTAGRKTEFRASPRSCGQLWDVEPPVPVVAYAIMPGGAYKREMMILEETWREALGAISDESLKREGQPSKAHFRRYWMIREKTAFRPLRTVAVYRVRPWRPQDEQRMGERLFDRLYGEYRAA
jgi:hypothetical protein